MYIGKHVKILLQSSFIVEGIVKEWSDSQVIIESIEEKSTCVILHPQQDIRVVKIFEIIENVTLQEVKQEPEPLVDDLKIKSLTKLKLDLIEQEKEIVASKLKNYTIEHVTPVKYEQPRFFKK
jgi:ribosomal protein L11 methylase PrmA